jgi:putative addiction module killer protein
MLLSIMFDILYFENESGDCPFERWYKTLDKVAFIKISAALTKIERGVHSNIKWFKGIGEFVIDSGPGYRIYLFLHGDHCIVLLGGGTKKSQQSDINQALDHYREFKARRAK